MTAIFAFVEDLINEGARAVAQRVRSYGADQVALAFAYHAARDVTPHGPSRVISRSPGLRFRPKGDGGNPQDLRPAVLANMPEAESLLEQCRDEQVEPVGWGVFLHNEELGRRHPEATHRNCFADAASPADLCPAHPKVQEYCVTLGTQIGALGVSEVFTESLHYGAFSHGYHHEREFVTLGALEKYLLGMCFCKSCVAAAHASGVDADEARQVACGVVAEALEGGGTGTPLSSPEELGAFSESLAEFVRVRAAVVTGLATRVAEEVRGTGATLTFLDLTGAVQGYSDGEPGTLSGVDESWKFGIDPAVLSREMDYGILAYARDPGRVASETARYRDTLAEGSRLHVLLRPGQPDCDGAHNLKQKVLEARRAGADNVDFYHYGLAPFSDLERIPSALMAEVR